VAVETTERAAEAPPKRTRTRELPLAWRPLPLLCLWIAAGFGLAALTGRARDWFDMTDELRYERLAISIARSHSLVPRIHGVDVQSFAQLYPLLIAPIFSHGLVPHDLVTAHRFDAWVMSSACIPAYLLAREVTGRRQAYVIAALSVVMPWIVYATMLMTEVAAYPAFLWALLAIHRATVRPSPGRDVLALAGLALAFFGRTALLSLVLVPPVAIIAYELGRGSPGPAWQRVRAALAASVRSHRVLAPAYVVLLVAGLVAEAEGKLSAVFGVYGIYAAQSDLVPPGFAGSLAEHVALLSLGFGVLPFLVGSAWLLATPFRPRVSREEHAFACVAAPTQATSFDIRYTGFVHDRFLLYLVPPVLVGAACALRAGRVPVVAFAVMTALVIAGFAAGAFPAFTWQQFSTLTQDSPMSGLLRQIVDVVGSLGAARVALALATALLAALALAASWRRARRALTALTLVTLLAMPVVTWATFDHFFGAPGWSLRPVTASTSGMFDWIDQVAGTHSQVTVVPYPVSSDWFASQQRWRDVEFYNASVSRDALFGTPNTFAYTGIWFPKLMLSFDPRTGRANASPTPWVAESDKDTRFALAGFARQSSGDVLLRRAELPWRAQWLSFGLYDDGWTKPHVTARVRVFPAAGQRRPRLRTLAFATRPADGVSNVPLTIASNVDRWHERISSMSTATGFVHVCVPPNGYAEIRISTPAVTAIPGDQATQEQSTGSRRGGVYFGELALGDEIGPVCRPASS
jgi:hypothetical protein